ncbi:MAG: 2-amino-4-hydroxy-6-hydroxymethyldihydropteridine diphosphokinase [Capnocytophaga sp.]|nr:2-amino-4-hydroxy-6-hydroxymethyldihydropteridine diphosphokinase [Capnocytophaga sp.]
MKHIIYISLGSNMGERLAYLQKAVGAVSQHIGTVTAVSPVYETPSWGFDAPAFLNACIGVNTSYTAFEVIEKLLAIEAQLGRVRTGEQGYKSRPIDLDILFYDDKVITASTLQIPHPQLAKRKFVLQPLSDIAPTLQHPIYKQTVNEMLSQTPDSAELHITDMKISLTGKKSPFDTYNYIAIEGNIGAGKTTLATKISEDFNAKLILERFADNPFLPKFYGNPKRYGFTLEMSFLTERFQQMSGHLAQLDLFRQHVVSDYDIFKSLIFSSITLTDDEFALYRKLFYILYNQIIKPELYVYLYQNTDRLIANIQKRGRDFEKNISKDYLRQINEAYLQYIQKNDAVHSLIIDVTEMDFVENEADYDEIIKRINEGKG